MKHLTKIAVFLIGAFALSFKAPPAVTTTTSEIIPFTQSVFVPCANGGAGEIVEISGNLHIVTHVTINGNNVSVKNHFQPQGAGGVGQTTGDIFNAVGVTQDQTKMSLQNGQAESTSINNFRLIGQGQTASFQVHQTVHTTINANGDATSTVLNSSTECD